MDLQAIRKANLHLEVIRNHLSCPLLYKEKKKTCVFGPTSKYAEHPTKPMFMLQIELKD